MIGVHGQSPSARPNLLGSNGCGNGDDNSILAALEGRRRTARHPAGQHRRRRWNVLLVVGLIGAGALSLWPLWKPHQFPSLRQQGPASGKVVTERATAERNEIPAADADAASPESQAAIINDLAPAERKMAAQEMEDARVDTSGHQSDYQIPGASLLRALEGNDAPLSSAHEAVPATQAKSKTEHPAAASNAVRQRAEKPSSRATTNRSGSSSARTRADSDVALLTELVATVNKTETATRRPQGGPPDLSADGNGKANRDIVERTTGDSTASLLARCRRLGFLEGGLCRWRICSGYESDPACAQQ